jgi:hypothetical protein
MLFVLTTQNGHVRGLCMTVEIPFPSFDPINCYIGQGGSYSCLVYKLLVITLIQRSKELTCKIKLYDVSRKVDLNVRNNGG